MTWQDAGVALIVLGALWFLFRRAFGAPPKKGTTTFVPLGQVKRRDDRGCH
jgi:hypothetical protein